MREIAVAILGLVKMEIFYLMGWVAAPSSPVAIGVGRTQDRADADGDGTGGSAVSSQSLSWRLRERL